MSKNVIQISKIPTFDLNKIEITAFNKKNQVAYFQSSQVFYFDKVYGIFQNRSRVLRLEKIESKYVETVIGAVIDAGFCGYLQWKIKLTNEGLELVINNYEKNKIKINKILAESQQLLLLDSPAGNYYDGTNQTNLEPEIVFER